MSKTPVKRGGTDDNKYEHWLCAFLFIKAGVDPTVEDFQLLNNVDGAGSFDDILLAIKQYSKPKWKEYVLQLKHCEKNELNEKFLMSEKNFINLTKECGSYKHFKSYYELYDTKASFDECTIGIFTNAGKNRNMDNSIISIPHHITENKLSFEITLNKQVVKISWRQDFLVSASVTNTNSVGDKNVKFTKISYITLEKLPDKVTLNAGKNEFDVSKDKVGLQFYKQVTKQNFLNIYCKTIYEDEMFGLSLMLPPGEHHLNISDAEIAVGSQVVLSVSHNLKMMYLGGTSHKLEENNSKTHFELCLQVPYVLTEGSAFRFKRQSVTYEALSKLEDGNIFSERLVMLAQQSDYGALLYTGKEMLNQMLKDIAVDIIESIATAIFNFVEERCKQGTLFFFTKGVFEDILAETLLVNLSLRHLDHIHSMCITRLSQRTVQLVQSMVTNQNGERRRISCHECDADMLTWCLKHLDVPYLDTAWLRKKAELRVPHCSILYLNHDEVSVFTLQVQRLLSKNSKLILVVNSLGRCGWTLPEQLETIVNCILIFTCNDTIQPDVSISLDDLDEDSKQRQLGKQVLFQGYPMQLAIVIGCVTHIWPHFRGPNLHRLLSNVSSGSDLLSLGPDLPAIPSPYISRTLLTVTRVNIELLLHEDSGLYIIENVDSKNSSTLLEMIPKKHKNVKIKMEVDRDDNEGSAGGKTVHYLTYSKDRELMWRKSSGEALPASILNPSPVVVSERDVYHLVQTQRCVVVADEPGAGKSLVLLSCAAQYKAANPQTLVLFLSLNDYDTYLSRHEFVTIDDVVRFFAHFTSHATEFDISLISSYLQEPKQCCVFMDEFDEICPLYGPKVSSIMSLLLNDTSARLVVATRHYVPVTFSTRFVYPVCKIRPFSNREQRDLLTACWSHVDDSSVLARYVDDAMRLVSRSFTLRFLGLPLQLKMLADTFGKKLNNIYDQSIIPTSMTILALFQQFIQLQVERMLRDVFDVRSTKAHFSALRDTEIRDMRLRHTKAALLSVFGDTAGTQLQLGGLDLTQDLQDIQDGREIHGFISCVSGQRPQFVHLTCAEYYVALWFRDNYTNNTTFIRDNFFLDSFKTIRTFFDLMLSEQLSLHTSIISARVGRVNWQNQTGSLQDVDLGGRNGLHVVVAYGNFDIVRACVKLFSADLPSLLRTPDNVYQWTPLQLADHKPVSWKTMGLLLEHGNRVDCLVNSRTRLQDSSVLQRAMLAALKFDFLNLFVFLKTSYDHKFNQLKKTTWLRRSITELLTWSDQPNDILRRFYLVHTAALFGSVRLFKKLLLETKNSQLVVCLACAASQGQDAIIEMILEKGVSIDEPMVSGATALHWACVKGHLKAVEVLVQHGADINCQTDQLGDTPLFVAIRNSHLDIAKVLLLRQANVELGNRRGEYPLHQAIAEDPANISLVEFCLEHDIGRNLVLFTEVFLAVLRDTPLQSTLAASTDINRRDECGRTALWYAATLQRVERTVELVEFQADPYITDNEGFGPFHTAVQNEDMDVLQALSKSTGNTASVNVHSNKLGETPLHLASEYGLRSIVVYLVEELNADLNHVNHNNQTALLIALTQINEIDGKHEQYEGIAEYLIAAGCETQSTRRGVDSAFLLAAEKGLCGVLERLLEHGVHVNEVGRYENALNKAVRCGQVDAARLLLQKDINIIQASGGSHPLHLAVQRSNLDLVKLLLHHGADVNAYSKHVGTPLQLALTVPANPLSLSIVKELILEGGVPVLRTPSGSLPLCGEALCNRMKYAQDIATYLHNEHHAGLTLPFQLVLAGNQQGLRALQHAQPGLSCTEADEDGWTLLHYSVRLGHHSIAKDLLEWGSDVNARTVFGQTPLYLAVLKQAKEIIPLLITAASVNSQTTDGNSPLLYCASKGLREILQLILCSQDIDVNIKDPFGKNSLELAIDAKHFEIANTLLERGIHVLSSRLIHVAIQEKNLSTVELLAPHTPLNQVWPINNQTPLETAFATGDVAIIQCLLRAGADIRCQNPLNKLAEKRKLGLLKLVRPLIETDCPILLQVFMATLSSLEELETLVEADASCLDALDECGRNVLHYAAMNRLYITVGYLVARGVSVYLEDNEAVSPLGLAVLRDDVAMLDRLLQGTVDINRSCNKAGDSPLLLAFRSSSKKAIQYLWRQTNININASNLEGDNCLKFAMRNKDEAGCTLLLQRNANVCCSGLLLLAAETDFWEVAEKVIEQDRDQLDQPDETGATPLLVSTRTGNEDMALYLLGAGADPDLAKEPGRCLVHYTVEKRMVRLLSELEGVDVVTRDGDTCLMLALRLGFLAEARMLLEKGADISLTNVDGEDALGLALSCGHSQLAMLLLNTRVYTGSSAHLLVSAVACCDLDVVTVLCERLPSVKQGAAAALLRASQLGLLSVVHYLTTISSFPSCVFESCIVEAMACGCSNIADFLVSFWGEGNVQLLYTAVSKGFFSTCKLLVDILGGASIIQTDSSLFALASRRRNKKLMRYFLDHGALVLAEDLKDLPLSLLEVVAAYPSYRFKLLEPVFLSVIRGVTLVDVDDLAQHASDVDELGRTPLYHAVASRNLKISRLLVENGADLNHRRNGTCLHWAVWFRDRNMLRMFLTSDRPLDFTIVDDNGLTASALAEGNNLLDMAAMLTAAAAGRSCGQQVTRRGTQENNSG